MCTIFCISLHFCLCVFVGCFWKTIGIRTVFMNYVVEVFSLQKVCYLTFKMRSLRLGTFSFLFENVQFCTIYRQKNLGEIVQSVKSMSV